MIIVNTVNIFPADNAVHIDLSNGKKYKILFSDYEMLPFECTADSRLDNITINTAKLNLSETNQCFDGDCVEFLIFLSRKYTIYRSAINKIAMTDIPKKVLMSKLYFSYEQNIKKYNRYKNNKIEIEPETLKTLCALVCEEFETSGYIDDRRYALYKAKYLKEYKKYGTNKIKEYLYQKGISPDIINEILEDDFFSDEKSNFEDMLALLRKKYGGILDGTGKADAGDIQKAINMLVRNGYKYREAKNAVADFIDNTDIDFMEGMENGENEDFGDG